MAGQVPAAPGPGHVLPVPMVPGLLIWDLCRTLIPAHRGLLLLTSSEIAGLHPADLAEVPTLDEWHHPDLSHGELPSETEAFRQLADAMEHLDMGFYQPTEEPNTHSSNWPDGGTL